MTKQEVLEAISEYLDELQEIKRSKDKIHCEYAVDYIKDKIADLLYEFVYDKGE
jgi:hypothetical protein